MAVGIRGLFPPTQATRRRVPSELLSPCGVFSRRTVMVDHVVAELAARQCGVFARCQVIDAGGDDSLVRRRRRSGRWQTCAPGVYGLPGHAETGDPRLWSASLAAGMHSVVSHEAAAALYRLPGFLRRMITLTVPHPEHQRVAGA